MIIALQALLLFRKTLITIFEQILEPYFINLLFLKTDVVLADDDTEDEVFSEFDDDKGVVFYPPVYAQRYAAVSDCLLDKRWCGKLEKVVDFGCNDMSFIKYLKDVSGVKEILGVDLDAILLRGSSELNCHKYTPKRENPLKISIFQGNAADPDYRLIGCDAVVSIEMIEHMMPHDLERFVHNVFGFIKPWVVIITTPNGDFNVLFKALEKNGLRRLDHFFEWTREQFHDWCSNIVSRYPQYSVTCKGIGPGPPGTSHLGCCSQLALFVAKEYHKQPDLDPNSLALVARTHSTDNVSDMEGSWDYTESIKENNMLCGPDSAQSLNSLLMSESQSYITSINTLAIQPVECQDKFVQCNVEKEFARNFIMFDDEMYHNIIMPRRITTYRVYDIENVVNRLNCTNHQVRKFSKDTHRLMAKNKLDINSKEVDEIRHLSQMLNFNKNTLEKHDPGHIWNNINWGENAPYWNQYYKMVREYQYPFEEKSNESRILELIAEEINRLIENGNEEWFSQRDNKMEIPIDYLMSVINHITDDEEKVRELLEWNGYEVVDNVVVYSRLIVDDMSEDVQEDWIDIKTTSDWASTDALSIPISEGVQKDLYDGGLRRALAHKIRSLRKLSKNKDVSTELDRLVGRLLKLRLDTDSHEYWLVYKLYDLLTLTENAMERRKKHFEDFQNIGYESRNVNFLAAIEEDMIDNILETYQDLFSNSDEDNITEYFYEEDASTNYESTKELIISITNKYNENDDSKNYNDQGYQKFNNEINGFDLNEEKNEKEFFNVIFPCASSTNVEVKNIIDIDINVENNENKIMHDDKPTLQNMILNDNEINRIIILNQSQALVDKSVGKAKKEHTNSSKYRKSKIIRKITTKTPSHLNFYKFRMFECWNREFEIKNQQKYLNPLPTSSQPKFDQVLSDCSFMDNVDSSTQENMFMKIVTMDGEEIIAFRRTIGTDPDINTAFSDTDLDVETVINVTKSESLTCHTEIFNEEESTLFLHDINEPSTSDGIRYFSTDVQCGLYDTNDFITHIGIANNMSEISKCKMGIKIKDSGINLETNAMYIDIGTSSIDNSVENTATTITKKQNYCMMLYGKNKNDEILSEKVNSEVKPVQSMIKIKNTFSKMRDGLGNLLKIENETNSNESQTLFDHEFNTSNESPVIYRKPQLSYGSIYVHCFKDRQNSEDIVYQGKWQQYNGNPKVVIKKNHIIYFNRKKDSMVKKKVVLKENNLSNYFLNNKVNVKYKKPVTVRNLKLANITKKSKTKMQNYKHHDSIIKQSNSARPATFSKHTKVNKGMSKVSSKIETSNILKKSNRTNSKNPFSTSTPVKALKDNTNIFKTYIPSYLKKRINKHLKDKNKNPNPKNILNKARKTLHELNFQYGRDTKAMLYKLPNNTHRNTTYLVYRNELDSEPNTSNAVEAECTNNYISASLPETPISVSPCSSPNSVGTVRNLSFCNKIDSNINYSTYSERSSSENYEPKHGINKNKKIVRKFKCRKKLNTSTANRENKESILESPRKSSNDEFVTKEKAIGRNSDTFALQITSKTLSLSKSKLQRSIQSTNKSSNNERYCNLVIKKSFICNNNQSKSKFFNKISTSNDNLDSINRTIQFRKENNIEDDHDSIEIEMKHPIEKNLNIEITLSDNKIINSKDPIAIDEIINDTSNDTLDLTNKCATCNVKIDSCTNIEKEDYKQSCELGNRNSGITDADSMSLKSNASMTTSKFSEYFSADNELDEDFFSQVRSNSFDSNIHLIQDAFDNQPNVLNSEGTIISADLNSSSINAQLNHRVDSINSVDTETGSHSRFAGHATSEGLISEQSSENTYESCSLNEDVQIPYWLFETDSEPDQIFSSSLSAVQPELDLNGNMGPSVVVGAGAGDGTGIHSDLSHTSSGRGTSLSSSGTSSLESQETLSNFSGSGQLALVPLLELQDVPASVLPNESSGGTFAASQDTRNGTPSMRATNNLNPLSDVDADISSLDTDAVDSDN